MLWAICLELAIVFLSMWILCERSLRIKIQQEMAKREGKLAEHEGKLFKLVSEFCESPPWVVSWCSLVFEQVFIYAHDLIVDFNDFAIPFHETVMGSFENKDLIAGAAGVEECLILVAFNRKSLCDLLEHGYDDALAQAGPIDARYAQGLAVFKRRMAELEAQWELQPDSDSDAGDEDPDNLEDSGEDEDEDDGLPSLFPAYDNKTRIVSFCDENGAVVPKAQDKQDGGELLA
ncbi:hypothetical protein LZ31DRAFT_633303 [Colletotrichum somersetense]|nr:hypothetical protein LZ31DRAFT_633303 [Colletotrichum somersetense]